MVAKQCLIACVVILTLILATVTALFLWYIFDEEAATAVTEDGTIKGSVVEGPGGDDVEEYLGIPYASPPVGNLRWAKPQPYGEYEGGSYKANDLKNACWGTTILAEYGEMNLNPPNPMSEDCLYLNIWVPRPRRIGRAVMVWFYGGGFQFGANSLENYNGRVLAEHGDVIVVSPNYRLGVFGFLSTGDDVIKGNFGLWDQLEALRWVKKNIGGFGGDSNLVTIFGESAGAFSVGYHALVPASAGLFKRIIQQSGSAYCIYSITSRDNAQLASTTYFDGVGCDEDAGVLECLRALPAEDLWQASLAFNPAPWIPVVDMDYMSSSPYHMLSDGDYPRYDTLIGVNQDEGGFFLLGIVGASTGLTQEEYDQAVGIWLSMFSADVIDAIKARYAETLPASPSDADRLDLLVELTGDFMFVCPSVNLTQDYTGHGSKVFYYYLTHRASVSPWPDWMGTIHAADIQWIFGDSLKPGRAYNEEEKRFTKDIMTYWSNFAKYGDPNGDDLPYWPQYTLGEPAYMELGNGNTTCRAHNRALPASEYCAMWAEENSRFFEA